ncbi:MAG: biotin--[acetyl-CoA-carboxylase] ligase [Streptosporangiales bacterium]|nr:biotin--[acetyl-CoA-carboxylase] ligase [Streptosporangiales bacterium]
MDDPAASQPDPDRSPANPDRPPLREEELARALVRPGALWREVRVVATTGSTNAALVARAREGAAEGTVLAAEEQTAGRGRLGRIWTAPPGAGLTFSVLLRPAVPAPCWVWLPLLTGVAVAAAVNRAAAVEARLKWPNDLLVGDRKLAGILVERTEQAERTGQAERAEQGKHGGLGVDAAVVGVGLNVTISAEELPTATATSLALEGRADVDRTALLEAILGQLEERYRAWLAAAGDPYRSGLRDAYRELCATLGRQVRVELPDGSAVVGAAADIDRDGALVVRTADGELTVGAGDVVHVR